MADSLGLGNPSHLATIVSTLTSIDQRLSRIEAALNLTDPHGAPPNPGVAQAPGTVAPSVVPMSTPSMLPPLPPAQNGPPVVINPSTGATSIGPVTFQALEPPPEGFTITSRDTMQAELDNWTIPRGYSMRIAGAKVTGKRKVRWVCFRGGEARHHRAPVDESVILRARAEGRRKPTTDRTSKKCGCLFKFEVIETAKDSDMWVLHYPNEEHKVHNHGPSDQTSDPRARKLPNYMLVYVDQWLKQGWLVSRIQEELKTRGFTNVLNTDLYNRKRLLKKTDPQMDVGVDGRYRANKSMQT